MRIQRTEQVAHPGTLLEPCAGVGAPNCSMAQRWLEGNSPWLFL
jgi:hypothetical protein